MYLRYWLSSTTRRLILVTVLQNWNCPVERYPDQSVWLLSFYNLYMSLTKNAKKPQKKTGTHGPIDRKQWFAGRAGSVVCWRHDRVGEGASDVVKILEDLSLFPKKKWEQMTKEQRGLARHLAVSYGMFLPLRLLSLADSHGTPAWYQLLRLTNEAASLLLKTITIRTMTLSFFLLPTLFHPHGRWTEVKAKPCSLTTSLLLCWLSVDVLMKWHLIYYKYIIIIIFFNINGTFKAACSSAERSVLVCACVAWRGEVIGLGEQLKWIMSCDWDLSHYLAWFLISRQHIIEEKRIGRKEVIRVLSVFVTCRANQKPKKKQKNCEQFACTFI